MRAFVRFRWLFYCKKEEIKRSCERVGNDSEREVRAPLFQSRKKKSIFIPVVTRTRFCLFFFFFGISSTSRRSDDATYSIYETDYDGGKRFRAL